LRIPLSLYHQRIRKLYGRPVTVITATETNCPTCGYNEVTKSGFDPFCPVCGGTGKVKVTTSTDVYCRVFWRPLRIGTALTGFQEIGDCYFFIDIEEEDTFRSANQIFIDGKEVIPLRFDYIDTPYGEIETVRVTAEIKHA